MGQLLETNKGLQHLDLTCRLSTPSHTCSHLMSTLSGVFMGQLLETNKGLQHLDLTNTRIGSATALVIGNGLKVRRLTGRAATGRVFP